jgi:hypothetical protein
MTSKTDKQDQELPAQHASTSPASPGNAEAPEFANTEVLEFANTQAPDFANTEVLERDKSDQQLWAESTDGRCSESAALFAASQPAPLTVV